MKNPNTTTPREVQWLLLDISDAAATIEKLATMSIELGNEDEQGQEALTVASHLIAQRIGWAADLALVKVGATSLVRVGDAESWMLPPAYHEDAGRAS